VKILWIEYQPGPLVLVDDTPHWPSDALPGLHDSVRLWLREEARDWPFEQREALRQAGASVHLAVGDPEGLYSRLAATWGMPSAARSATPWTVEPLPSPDPDAQVRATAELWAHIGHQGRRRDVMDARPELFTSTEKSIAGAQHYWQAGRYRAARRIWADVLPRTRAAERAEWDAQQVACRWVAGSYLRAALRASRAWRRAQRHRVSNPLLAEMWGRTVDHMSRSPDLFWLARIQRPHALAALDQALRDDGIGDHVRIRLESARRRAASRGHVVGEMQDTARARFMQSDSLSGILNYRHGRVRAQSPGSEIFRMLHAWHTRLGATADAARVPFLPGASRAFSWPHVARSLFGVQFSWWHRVRLLVLFVLDRVLRS
jgi:hypothetical protein